MANKTRKAQVPLDFEVDDLGIEGKEEMDEDPPVDGIGAMSNEGKHVSVVDDDLEGSSAPVKGFEFFNSHGLGHMMY